MIHYYRNQELVRELRELTAARDSLMLGFHVTTHTEGGKGVRA